MNTLATGIVLTPEHWALMEADVSSRAFEEACGMIAGEGNHSRLVIPVTNELHDLYRFRMDPKEELKALLLAEEKGWDILAVYHSHPHGIYRPSPTDFAELTFPGIIYLIWYQDAQGWQCRGYLMQSQAGAGEVPVIISTIE